MGKRVLEQSAVDVEKGVILYFYYRESVSSGWASPVSLSLKMGRLRRLGWGEKIGVMRYLQYRGSVSSDAPAMHTLAWKSRSRVSTRPVVF